MNTGSSRTLWAPGVVLLGALVAYAGPPTAVTNTPTTEQSVAQARDDERRSFQDLANHIQALGDTLSKKLEQKDNWESPATLVALFVAVLAGCFAIVTSLVTGNAERALRRDDQLFQALSWFEGKTQRRSIGIAYVEAHWRGGSAVDAARYQRTWIPVLVNQAIYLLTGSKSVDSLAEQNNCERIRSLLESAALADDQRKALERAFDKAEASHPPMQNKSHGGVRLDPDQRDAWKRLVKRPAATPRSIP
jgi:hypothetical protein